jgi:hypothetical protein
LQFSKTDLQPRIYADASHCIHTDGRGQGGIVITLGSAPIYCGSFKLKSITRSSSESELITLEEATTYVDWLCCLMKSIGLKVSLPIQVYQDNKSTILIAQNGGSFKRTKHLICKESYIREKINNGTVELKYLETSLMPADILTKPANKKVLNDQMQFLNIK